MEFDTSKFGLTLNSKIKTRDGEILKYGISRQGAMLLVSINPDQKVTIEMIAFGASYANTIAEHYRCDTQEQFDFLINNGPAGRLFNQVMKHP